MFYYASKLAWFVATPSNLLPLLILVGLLAMLLPRLRRFGWALALLATVGLFAAGLSPLGNWLILPLEERFPFYRDDGEPIAGIIVLGGSVQAEESLARGQLTLNDAGERVVALADLARRYPSARIVFTGGGSTMITTEAAEAAGLAAFIDALGLPRERLIVEDRSRTTSENAAFTRALVSPAPGERWLLVTSAWHMARAVGCFRRAGFPVVAYPVDYRTRDAGDAARPFAYISEGLRRVDVAAKEWVGLLAYRVTGRTGALFPGPR